MSWAKIQFDRKQVNKVLRTRKGGVHQDARRPESRERQRDFKRIEKYTEDYR